ncbi:hypothetical protein ACFWNL_18470 [Kitasatospora sp. NPDC058397]|uniref:hypothetical protein n=1 Tax=unclassified Kitasatospora TaxID=2633591 RepID=UPI00365C39F1
MVVLVGLAVALGGAWFALNGAVRREILSLVGGVALLGVGSALALHWLDPLIDTVVNPFL